MVGWIKGGIAAWKLSRDPFMQTAIAASNSALSSIPYQDAWPKETVEAYSQNLLQMIGKVLDAPNRVLALREQLAEAVLEATHWHALIITPEPDQDPMGLCRMQGITGQLKPHLMKVPEVDKTIRNFLYEAEISSPSSEDVYFCVLSLYWRGYWFAQTLHTCRAELKDWNQVKGRDWYRPFYHAMMVSSEATWRRALGLPPAIEDLTSLAYSTFLNSVLSGERFPDLHWRDHFKDQIARGSIKVPDWD